ncbi:hemerythrin domain-containing protein [Actinoallomurus rhizosphaericola]|uniref:hemerythrin domain-containing protein n=1 Tax=Actinoallomurus rhizosphaericola TaxID=2952536 RepID=UPI002090B88F|nr:hemerythrin domain-containing protein [Actinoallomurus rhizosphaericola]MCO5992085.1 hemerythrin domain-containing protein [Actinoallomurus rhizosphaericola]
MPSLNPEPTPPSPEPYGDRARALGRQLVEVHQWLRAELSRLRDEVADHTGGAGPVPLQAHCAAFCEALTRHHTSEDTTAFQILGERFPELNPVLEELRRDHRLVADILRRLQHLLATLTPENAEHVGRELDGLTAILESHFQWEERRLVAAFDALQAPAGEEFFGLTTNESEESR